MYIKGSNYCTRVLPHWFKPVFHCPTLQVKTLVVLEKSALVLDKIEHVEFFLVEAIMSMQSHDLKPSIRIHSLFFLSLLIFGKIGL